MFIGHALTRAYEIKSEAKRIDPDLEWTWEQYLFALGDNSNGLLTDRHIEAIQQAKVNLKLKKTELGGLNG